MMRKKWINILFYFAVAFLLLGFISYSKTAPSSQEKKRILGEKAEQTTTIEKVIDGDTIVADTGEVIRYIGMNTPEKGQPFANEATEENKRLVLRKEIWLEFDIDRKDRYGRTLAYLFMDGVLVNEELVKKGLAVSETIQPNVKHKYRILAAEEDAKKNCKGIWKSLCKPRYRTVPGKTEFTK